MARRHARLVWPRETTPRLCNRLIPCTCILICAGVQVKCKTCINNVSSVRENNMTNKNMSGSIYILAIGFYKRFIKPTIAWSNLTTMV